MFKLLHPLCAKRLAVVLVGSLTALILPGCGGGDDAPVSSETSKYQVAEDSSTAAADTQQPAVQPQADVPAMPAPLGLDAQSGGPAEAIAAGPAETIAPGLATEDSDPFPQPGTGDEPAAGGGPAAQLLPPDGTSASQTRPAAETNAASASFQVPDDPKQLVALLQKLNEYQPQGQTQQQLLDGHRQLNAARLRAANKLLATAKDRQAQMMGVQAKVTAMQMLAQLGDSEMPKALRDFSQELAESQDKDIARTGRLMAFRLDANSLASGNEQDVQSLLAQLKQLVSDMPDSREGFMVTGQAAVMLQQTGHDQAALEAYRAIGNAYKDSQTPGLASEARSLLQRALEIEVGLNPKLDALMAGKPDSVQPVMDALRTLLAAENPGDYLLGMSAQVGQLLEISGHYAEAGQALEWIEKAYQGHADKQLAEQAASTAENGRRRVALIGQPLVVEGVRADGSPLDWSQYQGKVVLIDFWATWCGPCLQEIPHMQRNYQAYRDKGFEIVGVNLDDSPETMKQFLAAKPLPWTSVVSADPGAAGFNNPLAVKCGVDAIPFMVLIGRDGNVNALHVRGERLDAKLAELLAN